MIKVDWICGANFGATQKSRKNVSCKAAPWRLELGSLDRTSKISGREAVNIFEKFKLGNYLDLDGGKNKYYNDAIRLNNLSFLDKVSDLADKKIFIDFYKRLTGFANLWNVAEKIKDEFKSAVTKSEAALKSNSDFYDSKFYDVLDLGYDGISSVAKRKALPGSDLDKAFVLLRGTSCSEAKDEEIVNKFKAELWKNTDQRILSYNHDADSFPKVYTEHQMDSLIYSIEDNVGLSKVAKAIPPYGIIEAFARAIFEKDNPSETYNNDYVDANSYFIDLCKKFPKKNSWKLYAHNPSRENIYNFCFVLEAMKWGEHFKDYYNSSVESSSAARHLNVSQIYSLKNSSGYKEKYRQREQLANQFGNWDIGKQFRFIKCLILNSCGMSTPEFAEYFKSSEVNKFSELMRAVGL